MRRHAPSPVRAPQRSSRMPRTLMVIALVAGLVAGGGGAAWALWSANATASGQATAAQLQVTTQNFGAISQTWANHSATASYTHTGSVRFSNTTDTSSSTPANLGIVFTTPTTNAQLAAALSVRVWSVSTATTCNNSTTMSGAIGTTWAAPASLTINTTLTAGETKQWCVRTSASPAERSTLATTVGSASVLPRVTGTLSIGIWTTSATANAAYGTQYIYPAYTGMTPGAWHFVRHNGGADCLDVEGNSASSGTDAISYPCKPDSEGTANQEWRFTTTDGGYLTLAPRHADSLRLTAAGSGQGGLVEIQSVSSSHLQQWQLQNQGSGYYQIVNRATGYCLVPENIDADGGIIEVTQRICNGTATQRWTLQDRTPAYALACTNQGSNNARFRVSPDYTSALTLEIQYTNGTWYSLGSVNAGGQRDVSGAPPGGFTWANGTYPVRAVHASGDIGPLLGSVSYTRTVEWVIFVTHTYRCP